jgi:hypothetical protein
MAFDASTVRGQRISEDAEYKGVRVNFQGNLGTARIPMQVDVGIGDSIEPGPELVEYPGILDFPLPSLSGYTRESTIAEKFQAMVKLGVLNSRMKDFYDIWWLSRLFDFRGLVLSRAIRHTFENRNTNLDPPPVIFESSFFLDDERSRQWVAFVRKSAIANAPEGFSVVMLAIKAFVEPVIVELVAGRMLQKEWKAPGPWR